MTSAPAAILYLADLLLYPKVAFTAEVYREEQSPLALINMECTAPDFLTAFIEPSTDSSPPCTVRGGSARAFRDETVTQKMA